MAKEVNGSSNSSIDHQSNQKSKSDIKDTMRERWTGDPESAKDIPVKELVELNPRVQYLASRKEKIDAQIKSRERYAEALEDLRQKVNQFVGDAEHFSSPIDRTNDVFARKEPKFTTTDVYGSYLTVDIAPGTGQVSDFKAEINRLASANQVFFGLEGTGAGTDPRIVYDKIHAAASPSDAVVDIRENAINTGNIKSDEENNPTNPYARTLYFLAVQAENEGKDQAWLESQVDEIFEKMEAKGISKGFNSKDSVAVGADKLNVGEQVFLSMAGGRVIADKIWDEIRYAQQVVDAIGSLAGTDQSDVSNALADMPSFADMETDADNIPDEELHPLAHRIAQAAFDEAATSNDQTEIENAGLEQATNINIKNDLRVALEAFPEGSEARDNELAKFIFDKVDKHSIKEGSSADVASFKNAVRDAYNEYIDHCKVSFEAGDSLKIVIGKINATTEYSGVKAEYVEIAPGNLILKIQSTHEGNNFDFETFGYNNGEEIHIRNTTDRSDIAGDTKFHENHASNAVIYIDDSPVVSSSNKVKYSEGVIITLRQPNTPGKYQNVSIVPDVQTISQHIVSFVQARNNLAEFLAEQSAKNSSNNQYLEDAVLGKEKDMNLFALKNILSSIGVRERSPAENLTLKDIGLELEEVTSSTGNSRYIRMNLDQDSFFTKFIDNPDSVRKLFGRNVNISSPELSVIGYNEFISPHAKFNISIDPNGAFGPDNDKQVKIELLDSEGNSIGEEETYDMVKISASSYKININNVNSPVRGLVMHYNSEDPVADIEVDITQGIAARAHSSTQMFTDNRRRGIQGKITQTQVQLYERNSRVTRTQSSLETQLENIRNQTARSIGESLRRANQAQQMTNLLDQYLKAMVEFS